MGLTRSANPYNAVTFHEGSVAAAGTTYSATHDGFGDATALRLQLNVTAISGTLPTLDVTLEDTVDGSNWNTVATFAQKTATGREMVNLLAATTPFANQLRVKIVTGGTTPTATFSVKAAARWED